jgi:hypothetical protein
MNSEENECIICMDNTKEILINNSYCACKIKWHRTCWDKYLQSTTTPKCPTCRKPLNELLQHLLPRPTAPLEETQPIIERNIIQELERITITLSNLQQSVQERFNEINTENIISLQQNQIIREEEREQQAPDIKKKRQLQAIILLLFLIGISIGIYKAVI